MPTINIPGGVAIAPGYQVTSSISESDRWLNTMLSSVICQGDEGLQGAITMDPSSPDTGFRTVVFTPHSQVFIGTRSQSNTILRRAS
jgi:hypothetical protein